MTIEAPNPICLRQVDGLVAIRIAVCSIIPNRPGSIRGVYVLAGYPVENAVYLALQRRTAEIFYWAAPNGQEVDFYLPGEKLLIQVAASLDQPATRERELRALNEAIQAWQLKQGLLLTSANALPTTMPAGTIATCSFADCFSPGIDRGDSCPRKKHPSVRWSACRRAGCWIS